MKVVKLHLAFRDERGSIETISTGKSWREVNRIVSEKGAIRGKHYHKKTEELIFILKGDIELDIKNVKTGKSKTIKLKENEGIIIEPYELHSAKIIKKTVWINFLTREFDKEKPDLCGLRKI